MADPRLVTHPLFADLEAADVNRMLDRIRLLRRDLGNDEVFLMQGDEYRNLAILVGGAVRATIEDMSGRSLLVETLTAPDVFAAPVVYSSQPRIPVTLTAACETTIWSIGRDDIDRLGNRFPAVYRRLLCDAGEKFVFLSTKLRLIKFASLRHKVAGYLLSLAREQRGGPGPDAARSVRPPVAAPLEAPLEAPLVVEPPYTRERLAELFGVARPSLSRTLGELSKEGVLRLAGSQVEIRSIDHLRRILRDEPTP